MCILSNQDIVRRIKLGELVIDPFRLESVGPESVDLHLAGGTFRAIEDRGELGEIDLTGIEIEEAGGPKILTAKLNLLRPQRDSAGQFYIHPGRVIVAYVKEYIKLPPDVAARVDGKSKIAQLGLQVESAGLVHAGWEGRLVLELSNLGEIPVKVSEGIPICQISFFPLTSPAVSPEELLALWKGEGND